jgi:hypothetical protein
MRPEVRIGPRGRPGARAPARSQALALFHECLALAESRGGVLVARAGVIEPLGRRSGSTFDPAIEVADLADADKATTMPSRPSYRSRSRSRSARHADHSQLSLLAEG